jgi:hypothetical protein
MKHERVQKYLWVHLKDEFFFPLTNQWEDCIQWTMDFKGYRRRSVKAESKVV